MRKIFSAEAFMMLLEFERDIHKYRIIVDSYPLWKEKHLSLLQRPFSSRLMFYAVILKTVKMFLTSLCEGSPNTLVNGCQRNETQGQSVAVSIWMLDDDDVLTTPLSME